MRLHGIVLAAGLSSRMGCLKALLPLGDQSVLSRCVHTLLDGGAMDVTVVTGHRSEDVSAEAARCGARAVMNPDYKQGMFTSIRQGVQALPRDAEGFFLLPVDIPLVRSSTVRSLMLTFLKRQPAIIYPRFNGERGHPPLINASLIPAILDDDGHDGMRGVLARFESDACDKDMPDSHILNDMDIPTEYERAKELLRLHNTPLPEECQALWDIADTPEATRAHCRCVADAACILAERLSAVNPALRLDTAIIRAAGLLHDVAKGSRNHEATGGSLLAGYGFSDIADIVASHRDTNITPDAPLSEQEMVFLADKYVRGTHIVALEKRYGQRLRQWMHDPDAVKAIKGRLDRAKALQTRYETEARTHLPNLLTEAMSGAPSC